MKTTKDTISIQNENSSPFDRYVSNTVGAFCAQKSFKPKNPNKIYIGRVFYRLFKGGEFNYRLFFENTIDSTYMGGEYGHPNEKCEKWNIHFCRVGVFSPKTNLKSIKSKDLAFVTFNNKKCKTVEAGEEFYSDEIFLKAEKNDYLCLEISFSGTKIPHLVESDYTIPTFKKGLFGFRNNCEVPGAYMVGCERNVKKRIAFFGDSITMGIGTPKDKYMFWVANIAEDIGEEYSFINLGIGCARCSDAATDGVWLKKAKRADFVNVCLGTNDILREGNADKIVDNLHIVVEKLLEAGCEVGLFTAPPFDYKDEKVKIWEKVNERIKSEFQDKVKYIFDTEPILDSNNHGIGKYSPHPNELGCKVISDNFHDMVFEKILKPEWDGQ